MRKLIGLIAVFVLIYFSFGVYIATFDIDIRKSTKSERHPKFWDFRSITHVLTKHTRGSEYPREILLDAASSKVDILFLTDLNVLNQPYNIQGYHGDIFTFTNQKISYLDSHVLVYTDDVDFRFPSITNAQTQLSYHFSRDSLNDKAKYLAVLAHPLKEGHQWAGKYPHGIDGIEVVNLRKLWQDVWLIDRFNFIASILIYPFNPKLALQRLLRDPNDEIKLWDHLNLESRTLGFLGSETTARIYHLIGLNFSFPKYQESFEFAANHLLLQSELTGNEERDREKIFGAFRDGHFYLGMDTFGKTRGFAAYMEADETIFLMGDNIKWSNNLNLHVDLPEDIRVPFEVELYQNGKRIWTTKQFHDNFSIKEPGNYRVTVRINPSLPFIEGKRWYTWIYTNNFYVK